jgi:hypothetical protein
MPDLDVVMRGLMRDIGAALRPKGFRYSGGRWRLVMPEGVAVIHKQAGKWSRSDAKQFYLDTAVAPTEWLEWVEWQAGRIRPMPGPGDTVAIGLLESRVPCPSSADIDRDRWQVTADTDVDRLRGDLVTGVMRAADRLVELLQPGRYLDELRAVPHKGIGHWPPLVILLAARGPSSELDAACAGLRNAFAERPRAAGYADDLIGLAHTYAERQVADRLDRW